MREKGVGELLLEAIYDDVDQSLNPDNDECWYCGGDGATYDCIDGFCADPESGCADCYRPCQECVIYNGKRAKAVREAVIASGNTDIAIAWLKKIGRWSDDITRERVAAEMEAARLAMEESDRPSPAPKDGSSKSGGA